MTIPSQAYYDEDLQTCWSGTFILRQDYLIVFMLFDEIDVYNPLNQEDSRGKGNILCLSYVMHKLLIF